MPDRIVYPFPPTQAFWKATPQIMDDRLTVRAAYLYYRSGLTQAQVAERLGISRVKVTRLLQTALEREIVTIDIRHPLVHATTMEVELEARYGLDSVVVAVSPAGSEGEDGLRLLAVGAAGADFLRRLELRDGRIAVGWGTTMQAVSVALAEGWASNMDVFQLNGAVPLSGYATGATEILYRFSERAGGRAHPLQVPAIVDKREVREALESESSVQTAVEGAKTASVAIFSLGRLQEESVLVSSGYIDRDHIGVLRSEGAVGDVISRFITADGTIADTDLDERTMGVNLSLLGSREITIGVAAGAAKVDIVRGAIAGGYVNTLIVDDSLAAALLAD